MILKEAIKEVVSNRPSLYPNGWDTEIGKILQNTVQDFSSVCGGLTSQ